MKKWLLAGMMALWMIPLYIQAQEIAVVPYPETLSVEAGSFGLDRVGVYGGRPEFMPEAAFLCSKLDELSVQAKTVKKKSKANLILAYAPDLKVAGAYRLEVTPRRIIVSAAGREGIFYGVQTLLQLAGKDRTLGCCRIADAPRYAWRGFMLDEARHFFGKEKVKELLDWMAYFKLNKFHWHLTDETGWRVEIKKYPRLTTVGGKGNWSEPDGEEARFYTQEEIREILDYASARHIEVIPEIDMPGHATAANKAYSELSGGGTPEHPDFTFNVGKEEVYAFLTEVLREVADLFPSSYLHIGGDEVAYGIKAWETDPHVQGLMRREGMKQVKEAERYFMHRMADSVRLLGKTLVGWDELVDLNVPVEGTQILWWRHDRVNQLKKSLSGGYATVLCPRRPLYFDFVQHKTHKWGRVWNGFCPLEDVYAFPDKGMASWQIPQEQMKLVKGIQANLWTERVQHAERLDFMTFPRLCALAEAAWTAPEKKDYESFCRRMETVYDRFDRAGIYYFDARRPERHPEPEGAKQKKRDMPMDFRD